MASRNPDLDLGRLCIAMQRARLTLARQRQIRADMVADYAGPYYGAEKSTPDKTQPINLLALYVSIISRKLISQNPRVMLSTFEKDLKPVVAAMEAWANEQLPRMKFAEEMKRAVLDALFSVGIVKVAIGTPPEADLSGNALFQAGEPYMMTVDFDDYVYDVHARKKSEYGFEGHRFRVPRESVIKSKLYGNKGDLPASDDRLYNLEGDERISVLGRGMYADQEEYEDFVDLWEVYLPRKGVVVTLADDSMSGASTKKAGDYEAKALRVQKWIGPATGPYHVLCYVTVPGNAPSKGPVQDVYDLHNAINQIFRKLIRQAGRQKENTFYPLNNPEDAERIRKSNDGELVGVTQPDKINRVEMGGPNQLNHQLGIELIQRLSWMAGNLDIMGGLSPQSKTAHQDAQMQGASTQLIADMQETTVLFTEDVVKSLLWFYHHHPALVMRTEHKVPGLADMGMTRHVGPPGLARHPQTGQRWDEEAGVGFHMTRDHAFEDMHVQVDPYSLMHKTPEQRMQLLSQLVKEIMPLMQAAQQQGVMFNLQEYIKVAAKCLDEPDLETLFSMQEPPMPQDAGGAPEQAGMPAETTTTHIRENMPGRTQAGDAMNQRNALMGVNPGGAPNTNGQANGAMK